MSDVRQRSCDSGIALSGDGARPAPDQLLLKRRGTDCSDRCSNKTPTELSKADRSCASFCQIGKGTPGLSSHNCRYRNFFVRAYEESEHRSLANDMQSRHKIAYLSIDKVRHTEYTLHLNNLSCLSRKDRGNIMKRVLRAWNRSYTCTRTG